MPDTWTPARVKKLKALSKQGLSHREIAKKLGSDVSPKAVSGKIRRMELKPNASSIEEFSFPSALECRWPDGHPGEDNFSFCRKETAPGKPYCEEHCEVAYRKKNN